MRALSPTMRRKAPRRVGTATVTLALSLFFLGGCASSPDQKSSAFGGYKVDPVASDVYHVSFSGNSYTSFDRVRLSLMYRCAEVTLEKGCDYYAELTPEQIQRSLPTLVVSPGATLGTPSAHKASTVIRLFKGGPPPDFPQARNARMVKEEIEPVLFPSRKP
jgi:hypothetical protein